MADKYTNFSALAEDNIEDSDYRILVNTRQNSSVAIVAPHGGSIERRTSEIASAIAGNDHNLYLFEGLDPNGTFDSLHITSHKFDEPSCLALVENASCVICVHGCAGKKEEIYLGGLDSALKTQLHESLTAAGIQSFSEGHKFQGTHPRNICNRGTLSKGVQIEFSDGLRGAPSETIAVQTIRQTLSSLNLADGSR